MGVAIPNIPGDGWDMGVVVPDPIVLLSAAMTGTIRSAVRGMCTEPPKAKSRVLGKYEGFVGTMFANHRI